MEIVKNVLENCMSELYDDEAKGNFSLLFILNLLPLTLPTIGSEICLSSLK